MQTYHVKLESEISDSYKCKRAADSLDIDVKKKSIHELNICCDIEKDFNIGLIIGSSGSGKTTLAKKIYGENCFKNYLNNEKTILDQFPEKFTYDECAEMLTGIGLSSVPCWIRPIKTLSNGQKSRAEAALSMCQNDISVIDEWTSVVDRTVAKVMSHCIQKHARKTDKKIVLLSCHYDVIDWINPDWIIDCNKQEFIDRRLLCRDFKRSELLKFEIKKCERKSWKYFSKYHYLSENLPGGYIETFGLFLGLNQIGFQCFANYVPHSNKNKKKIMHFNRTVIHPDYCGFGLGIHFINKTAEIMNKIGFKIMGKFSSIPVYKSLIKSKHWKCVDIKRQIGNVKVGENMSRKVGFRENIKTFSFEFLG